MSSIARDLRSDPVETEMFWGEMTPCEHLLQIYEHDGAFLDSLESYVGSGLDAGEGVIVVATRPHLAALHDRLRRRRRSLAVPVTSGQYVAREAEESIAKFLVQAWPDERLFEQWVRPLLAQARGNGRPVRAFGEMVALMWGRGLAGATVRLEHLWRNFCRREAFSLFCAYPRIGFTQDADSSIREIRAAHSRFVA